MRNWALAAEGTENLETLDDNPVHLYHGALISYYLGQPEKSRNYANKLMQAPGISAYEGERAADILALLGEYESALGFYKGLQLQGGDSDVLATKIMTLQERPDEIQEVLSHLEIENPAAGAALAAEDLARILYQENSDGSAQLFVHMALALHPALIEAYVLLGDILARNGRHEEAIAALKNVPESHYVYLETRFRIADMMAQSGQKERSRGLLEDLYKNRRYRCFD